MSVAFNKCFIRDEDGAVTVDWVVLTAAVLGMSILVVGLISDGATNTSTGIGAKLSSAELHEIEL